MVKVAGVVRTALGPALVFTLFFFFLAFSGFIIDRTAEECDRKQGKRGGATRSKGTGPGVKHC